MLKSFRPFLLLLLALPLPAAEVRITYLANEGVMIESGGHKLLIDALLRDSLDAYARHSPQVQEQIETGRAPFDDVTLALATHYHLDHWDAGAISRFLKNNPAALFASTPQATGMIPRSQQKQVRALWPADREAAHVEVDGIKVSAIRLDHGRTENLGYRIEIGGKILYHVGDSGLSESDCSALAAAGHADVLLVPYWVLLDPKPLAFLKNVWKPDKVIAFHVGSNETDAAAKIATNWPGAWFCTKPGESRSY